MHHARFDAFTRRAALRGLAAALLGGAVAGLPAARRATSVLAGDQCTPEGGECAGDSSCCEGLVCDIPAGEDLGICVVQSDKDNDKPRHKHNESDDNDDDGNGGNTGDGIFWPCLIPWFANNPACSGRLESLGGG